MELTLRYGRQGLPVTLPDANVRHVLRMNELPVLPDPARAVREVLADPIASPPLAELAQGRCDAVIVVSDLTRPVPNALLLPPVLETLAAAGLSPERVTILVATGLHRGNTEAELAEMLGPEAMAAGCRIVNHEARDAASHVDLGRTPRGMPVQVDRRYVEADLKILTGLIEPHLMAGYSGGRKAICPGLCSVETVLAWHSAEMLDPDEARAGNLWRNPVHEEALAVADLANDCGSGEPRSRVFLLNVVLNEARELTGVFAGEMRQAHLAGMELAERQTKVELAEPVDIVVTTSAGYPLDLTFYQGVKG
ncbi:MAG: nickel-dependent lactate racemase, partial [Armatimonadetes bacterium]|nr:nickel-dependent lactate racemase [Armatimonadota bacterium]